MSQNTTNPNPVTQSFHTLHTILNTSIFNMVQLELVDWEEIFQEIRVWCTFNPFIVYLFSGKGPKRVNPSPWLLDGSLSAHQCPFYTTVYPFTTQAAKLKIKH